MTLIVLSLALVSAGYITTPTPTSLYLNKNVSSVSFNITNTNVANSTSITIPSFGSFTDDSSNSVLITQTLTGAVDFLPNQTQQVTLSYNTLPSNFELGSLTKSITLTDGVTNTPVTLNLVTGFCSKGNQPGVERYLEITRVKDTSSSDDFEWKPLDTVDIEVKVEFNNNDDNDDQIDGIIEIGLYDTDTNDFVDIGDDSDTQRDFSLDEGDSATETLTITVPLDEVEDSTSRYKLYVKVYEDGEEDNVCRDYVRTDANSISDYFQDIKISKESYDVIAKDIEATTTPLICGQEAQITAKVYNLGTHDEDEIYVSAVSTALGLNQKSEAFSLDKDETGFKRVNFDFVIPTTISEGTYTVSLSTYFKYSDSSDTYRESNGPYTLSLQVEGPNCKGSETKNAQITAQLSSETPSALTGKELIIEATIKNTGTTATEYDVSISGNSLWSEVAAVDPKTFTLNAGESKKVTIYLNIDKDATPGDKDFTIKASYGSDSKEQKVSINVEKSAGLSLVSQHLKANWLIYLIVLINIILIIAIIIVVVRIVSRPSRA